MLEDLEAAHHDKFVYAVLFLLVDAAGAQTERDVIVNRQPREQRVLLKHEAAVCTGGLDRCAVQHQTAVVHRNQTGDQTQQRGLAAAGRSDQ